MKSTSYYLRKLLKWMFVAIFVVFYPMIISIYVFLPLFIGIVGYFLILGIEKGKITYIVISLLYFINMDANLSLPFFMISTATLIVYLFFYPRFMHFRKCHVCTPLLTVFMVDMVYLALLLSYDFIFGTENVVLDDILIYTLIVDLLVAVLL
ncbi:hypothetical protein MNB_SV-4-75 [hydrothermal vent metagenome]|uniref:Uncharacterized protein n=1 Tax=hydrothermal vent metagenome TaxID=652676 RepID=A0A1W1E7U1_9ZZZZ